MTIDRVHYARAIAGVTLTRLEKRCWFRCVEGMDREKHLERLRTNRGARRRRRRRRHRAIHAHDGEGSQSSSREIHIILDRMIPLGRGSEWVHLHHFCRTINSKNTYRTAVHPNVAPKGADPPRSIKRPSRGLGYCCTRQSFSGAVNYLKSGVQYLSS